MTGKFLMNKEGRVFVYDRTLHINNEDVRVVFGEVDSKGHFIESGGDTDAPTLRLDRQTLGLLTKQQLFALFPDLIDNSDQTKEDMIASILGGTEKSNGGASTGTHQGGSPGVERLDVRPGQQGPIPGVSQ